MKALLLAALVTGALATGALLATAAIHGQRRDGTIDITVEDARIRSLAERPAEDGRTGLKHATMRPTNRAR